MTTATAQRSGPRWRDGLIPTLIGWIWARVCIAVGFALAHVMVDILDNPSGTRQIREGLFTWDGSYYKILAEQWYTGANLDAARFFPVYPALAKLLTPVIGGRSDVALLVISNVCAFAGAFVLWRLVVEVIGDSEVADRSAWMLAIFPSAFVLAFAYTEGLAILLVAATLLALHRKFFITAGLLALLSAALRPVGGLLLLPIAIEMWQTRPRPRIWTWMVATGGPVAGLVLAILWIERATHDLFLPIRLQQQIRGGFQDPVTRVLEPMGELVKGNFRDTYNLGFMLVLLFLGLVAIRKRQPLSWLVYAAASLVLLLSSQVTDSLGRYGLVVVPFIVALAQWSDARWRQLLVAIGCSAGIIWLTSEALLGRMVP